MFRTLAPLDSERGQRKARDTKFAWILRLLRRWWVLSTCGRREFEMFFVRLGFCKERKSSRFNDRIETRKAYFFFWFVLVRAKRSFQTRASSNKNTQSERRWGDKIFRSRYWFFQRRTPKPTSCERWESCVAVAHSHIIFDLRRLFFFYPHVFKRSRRRQEQRDVPQAVRITFLYFFFSSVMMCLLLCFTISVFVCV